MRGLGLGLVVALLLAGPAAAAVGSRAMTVRSGASAGDAVSLVAATRGPGAVASRGTPRMGTPRVAGRAGASRPARAGGTGRASAAPAAAGARAVAGRPAAITPRVVRAGARAPARAVAPAVRRGPATVTWRAMAPRAGGPRVAAPRRGAPALATAGCARGGCRGLAGAPRILSVGWTRGLTPAAGVQARDCPSGTWPTLARGHSDVVRCVPL